MIADSNAWYTYAGSENDTVISSRVRLARNLSQYHFPPVLEKNAAEEVYVAVNEAFQSLSTSDVFHSIRLEALDAIAKKIFEERSILPPDSGHGYAKGIIVRDDGVLSATVNVKDHVRISAFYAGFEVQKCFDLVKSLADNIAETLDFSAVKNFGYLSSDIMSIGSGVKSSVLCSLPGYSLTNRIQEKIEDLTKKNFEIHAYYAQDTKQLLGYLYLISSKSSAGDTAETQIATVCSEIRTLIDEERELRQSLIPTRIWRIQDMIIKAFSLLKNAHLLDVKETIDALFKIKLGISLGLIEGVSYEACIALLYQAQTAHIAFLLLNGTLEFEDAFPLDELRIERIRALLVQDLLKNAEMRVRNTFKLKL